MIPGNVVFVEFSFPSNHNYNKIVKSDWLSTALISALIGQFNTGRINVGR